MKAEEHIQYEWPWIYLEKMFLILSQMLPSVTLTLSEKLGREEMGREGEKEAQNQHKNRNIKVSFSRQTSRHGGGEKKINLGSGWHEKGEGKADPGRPSEGVPRHSSGSTAARPGLRRK